MTNEPYTMTDAAKLVDAELKAAYDRGFRDGEAKAAETIAELQRRIDDLDVAHRFV